VNRDGTNLIHGEKSVTSITSEQAAASHSENSRLQRSEHPSPPEHIRFRERKPLPHSAEHADHSDHGEKRTAALRCVSATRAAEVFGQLGRLSQNWL
jgi:hypothetical protein